MPRPNTPADAVALVRASELVPEDRLGRFLSAPSSQNTPDELFDRLVADGLLTAYQAAHLRAGRWRGFRLGGYRLLDKLGSGGMGLVYLGEHERLGRRAAVKVLHADPTADPTVRGRFLREAKAAARVDHPNVVRVYDVEMDATPPFLALEYVDGSTLHAAVSRHGPLAPGEAAECGRQAALGLHAAGQAGLIHRDVKPANILIDRAGRVKLTDLGMVRMADDQSTRLSAVRQLLGTLDYLPPEQATDDSQLDHRADVYGLGATLYFLLAGHPPFPDGNLQTKLARILTGDPVPLPALRSDLPPGLAAVIHRMMAKAPADRYPTAAAAVAAALAPFAGPRTALSDRLFAVDRRTLSDIDGPHTCRVDVSADLLAAAGTDETPRLADTSTDLRFEPTPSLPSSGHGWLWPAVLMGLAAALLAGLTMTGR